MIAESGFSNTWLGIKPQAYIAKKMIVEIDKRKLKQASTHNKIVNLPSSDCKLSNGRVRYLKIIRFPVFDIKFLYEEIGQPKQ